MASYKDEAAMLVDGIHEPLINTDLFYDVQDVLAGKRAKNRPENNSTKEELLLRGYIKCGRCGKNLTGSGSKGHGGRYFYYHCKNGCKERFRADTAHEQFYGFLEQICGNKKLLKTFELHFAKRNKKEDIDEQEQSEKLRKEIQVCQNRLMNAQTKFLDDQLSPSDYSGIKARFEPEIARLTKKQAELISSDKNEVELIAFGLKYIHNLPKLFMDADLHLKHRILGSTFPKKLLFENGECRTYDSDNVLMLIAKSTKGLRQKKDGEQVLLDSPSCCVVPPGFEPRLTEPKSVVLPLHNGTNRPISFERSANVRKSE